MTAVHGSLVFWSQTARMYMPGTFLCILSLVLLLTLFERGERRRLVGASYLLTLLRAFNAWRCFGRSSSCKPAGRY